jgi:hypothetical protein
MKKGDTHPNKRQKRGAKRDEAGMRKEKVICGMDPFVKRDFWGKGNR